MWARRNEVSVTSAPQFFIFIKGSSRLHRCFSHVSQGVHLTTCVLLSLLPMTPLLEGEEAPGRVIQSVHLLTSEEITVVPDELLQLFKLCKPGLLFSYGNSYVLCWTDVVLVCPSWRRIRTLLQVEVSSNLQLCGGGRLWWGWKICSAHWKGPMPDAGIQFHFILAEKRRTSALCETSALQAWKLVIGPARRMVKSALTWAPTPQPGPVVLSSLSALYSTVWDLILSACD